MTPPGRSARVQYETPAVLADSDGATPVEMRDAFASDVARLTDHHESSTDQIAVQGPVSSMKTWLLTCTAEAFLARAQRATVLVPQKVNRRDVVDRIDQFGVSYVEHPGRRDLCVWQPWKETIGRVDERICSSNGCPLYPDGKDMEQIAVTALGKHRMETGGPDQLDEQTIKNLADMLEEPVCPHYLQEALVELVGDENTIQVATYAKAFEDANSSDRLAADVALLDESHTIIPDVSRATTQIDLSAVTAALSTTHEHFEGGATKRARDIAPDISFLESAFRDWEVASWERPVTPDELFAEAQLSLSDAFNTLDRAHDEVMTDLRRAVRKGPAEGTDRLGEVQNHLRDVVEVLACLRSYRDGDLDFIHTKHEARGDTINKIEFRRVADRETASTPREVYEAWCRENTHPAIAARWGDLLDHYIEAVWSGRTVVPGGDRNHPGAPPSALAELGSITGVDTLIGYSATHNDASDPTRDPDDLRRTAHRLVAAPLQLRSDGDERSYYHGRTAVDAATPWFQDLLRRSRGETDAKLAAVPINSANKTKWEAMPVETLELPDGRNEVESQAGLVPHSRGAIGDKELEQLPVDAVLCGVQVQGPADTARRVVALWELLAPEHDDPTEALERG